MSVDNEALNDEVEALNSIYGPDTLTVTSTTYTGITGVLKLPELPISFLFSFPTDYPDCPPSINGTQSIGSSQRGEGEFAVSTLRDVLARVWQPGQACLFDMIEDASPLIKDQIVIIHQDHCDNKMERSVFPTSDVSAHLTAGPAANAASPPWTLSDSLTVNKSTFIARVCPVSSLSDATEAIAHLTSTDKKVATATHNITAWRIQNTTGESDKTITIQDCDDDGETAAGGRLLHLMQLMDVWNVVVVVTRWYGGVKLGSDRFRLINNVAREALLKGGFAKEDDSKSKGKSRKK